MSERAQTVLPRWRGFNLTQLILPDPVDVPLDRGGQPVAFVADVHSPGGVQWEDDFRWMSDWGFDFTRLALCYRHWIKSDERVISKDDVYDIDEAGLEHIDRAVDLGAKYGLHVCLNFHWAPGYRVEWRRFVDAEPFSLWKDAEGQEAFCYHWSLFAKRYKGISPDRLSFNLVNEPDGLAKGNLTRQDHERVMRATVGAIREIDPDRLIILDGIQWGQLTCPELIDLNVAQSCRGYQPRGISHYGHDKREFPTPVWPGAKDPDGGVWDRQRLEDHYAPWVELARQGVGVHCGECGGFNFTPHQVFLDWLRDVLDILTGHNIGFGLWNLRGPLGVMDSNREDVDYEDFEGHKLDRRLLELLQEF